MTRLAAISRIKQRGFSLIELMVSITIGLVITFAIGGFYLANKTTFRRQDDASRLQETGRAALDVLGYHIRQAGYVDVADDYTRVQTMINPANLTWENKQYTTTGKDILQTFFGASGTYSGIQAVMGCNNNFNTGLGTPWTCGGSGGNSITVAYQAQPTTVSSTTVRAANTYLDTLGAYNAATGQGGDCGANDVAGASANPNGPIAINRFYVDTATKRLMCAGSGNPTVPQPIAEGVESMQLLYGIVPATVGTAPMDGYIGQYVAGGTVTDWSKVLAVRVCLQIASPTQYVAPEATKYVDCSGTTQTVSDGKIRQIYRATFSLRNNVLTNPDTLP